ncbi:MAG: branched-chain amino acid ABC transporter permease [Alphaproteobacteria bacterium]|nr:branched-chain amino acid ABC transporter permease [Alphaproteobacteria bacterium]
MDFAAIVVAQVLFAIASLALISVGLAIIFGMMRVINFAHGEFLMMGGFTALLLHQAGLDLWLAMFVAAPLVVGLFGVVVERLIIRPLYGRIFETVLATWGLSLLMIGVASVTVGYYQSSLQTPLGSVAIGDYRESGYTFFVIAVAAVVLAAVYAGLRYTRFGLLARGTMQNPAMAAALGVDTGTVYAVTFFVGSALSGLAGAVLMPLVSVSPIIGFSYIARAFITVIGGGAVALAGTMSASGLFGSISQFVAFVTTPVVGEVALLAAAIVLLRLLPEGITGRYFRSGL